MPAPGKEYWTEMLVCGVRREGERERETEGGREGEREIERGREPPTPDIFLLPCTGVLCMTK